MYKLCHECFEVFRRKPKLESYVGPHKYFCFQTFQTIGALEFRMGNESIRMENQSSGLNMYYSRVATFSGHLVQNTHGGNVWDE